MRLMGSIDQSQGSIELRCVETPRMPQAQVLQRRGYASSDEPSGIDNADWPLSFDLSVCDSYSPRNISWVLVTGHFSLLCRRVSGKLATFLPALFLFRPLVPIFSGLIIALTTRQHNGHCLSDIVSMSVSSAI